MFNENSTTTFLVIAKLIRKQKDIVFFFEESDCIENNPKRKRTNHRPTADNMRFFPLRATVALVLLTFAFVNGQDAGPSVEVSQFIYMTRLIGHKRFSHTHTWNNRITTNNISNNNNSKNNWCANVNDKMEMYIPTISIHIVLTNKNRRVCCNGCFSFEAYLLSLD